MQRALLSRAFRPQFVATRWMSASLAGSKTHANLRDTLAGLSVNAQRYEFMALQADVDGLTETSTTFRSIAKGEASQATGTLEFLTDIGDPSTDKPIGDTMSNLESALVSEDYEAHELYPAYAATAREEGFEDVAEWFDRLAQAQTNHWATLKQRSEELKAEN